MGSWGTGISSNDEYMDIYSEIMEDFNKGTPIQNVLNNIIKKYKSEFEDDCNSLHNLYFAAAFASWECGLNDEKIYRKVKEIVISGSDIKCWRELEASASDLKKREKALTTFLDKISIPKINPKRPKAIKYKPALFDKGDILSISLDDGNYSGALVLENANESDEIGVNYIVKAYLSQQTKPTIEDVFKAKVYDHAWYSGLRFKKYIKQIEKIGKIDIKYNYVPRGAGSTYSSWANFVSINNENYYCIRENSDIQSILDFLKLTPDDISKRNLEKVRRSFNKLNKG